MGLCVWFCVGAWAGIIGEGWDGVEGCVDGWNGYAWQGVGARVSRYVALI